MKNWSAKQNLPFLKTVGVFICAIAVPFFGVRPPNISITRFLLWKTRLKLLYKSYYYNISISRCICFYLPTQQKNKKCINFSLHRLSMFYSISFNTCMTSQYQCWERKKISSRARKCLMVRLIQILADASRMTMTHTVQSLKFVLTYFS